MQTDGVAAILRHPFFRGIRESRFEWRRSRVKKRLPVRKKRRPRRQQRRREKQQETGPEKTCREGETGAEKEAAAKPAPAKKKPARRSRPRRRQRRKRPPRKSGQSRREKSCSRNRLRKAAKPAAKKAAKPAAKASAKAGRETVAKAVSKSRASPPKRRAKPAPKTAAKSAAKAAIARPSRVAAPRRRQEAPPFASARHLQRPATAAWFSQGDRPRSSSFIPAPPRAEAPSLVAAPPASSDRLVATHELTEFAVRTVPVRIDIEAERRPHLPDHQSERNHPRSRRRHRVGFPLPRRRRRRHRGDGHRVRQAVAVRTTVFRSRRPGAARPHRQLSGPAQESAAGKHLQYTVRAFNAFKTEMASCLRRCRLCNCAALAGRAVVGCRLVALRALSVIALRAFDCATRVVRCVRLRALFLGARRVAAREGSEGCERFLRAPLEVVRFEICAASAALDDQTK